MPPAVGTYPMMLGVIADVGQTSNSSQTWSRMAAQGVQVATLVGDWTYADDYLTNSKCLATCHLISLSALLHWLTSQLASTWGSFLQLAFTALAFTAVAIS